MPITALLAAAMLAAPGQTTPQWTRTDDGSGALAQAYFAKYEKEPEAMEKVKRIPTVFFYWKARWILNFEVGEWERAHLNVSRIVLEVLDPETGKELKAILDAHKAGEVFAASDEETKAFRARIAALSPIDITGERAAATKLEMWEFQTGVSLGDLGGKVIQYHGAHSIATANKMFNETLDGFKKLVETAPVEASPKMVAALKVIAETPRKTSYSPEEIKKLGGQIKAALLTVIPES